MDNCVRINGELVPVTPLRDFLKTKDGLIKTLTWYENQKEKENDEKKTS